MPGISKGLRFGGETIGRHSTGCIRVSAVMTVVSAKRSPSM